MPTDAHSQTKTSLTHQGDKIKKNKKAEPLKSVPDMGRRILPSKLFELRPPGFSQDERCQRCVRDEAFNAAEATEKRRGEKRTGEERTAPVDAALKLLITCSRKTSGVETREERHPLSSNYLRN